MRKCVKPVGTRPGTMYGLCKVHKQQVGGWPPFLSILSALQIPTYNFAKFLVPILNPLSTQLKTHFDLLKRHFLRVSLLLKLLIFPSISCFKTLILLKALQIQSLNNNYHAWLQRTRCFIFNDLLYKQTDIVAMGSTLGPFIDNAFLSSHEKKLLKQLSSRI